LAAERRPEAVKGLFLAAAAPWLSGERDGVAGGLPEEFLRFATSQQANGSVPYAQICFELGDDWLFRRRQSAGVYQWVLQQSLEWPQHVTNLYAASLRHLDHRGRLSRVSCPTVILQGRHDRKQRYEGAVYLAKAMPRARLITFEDAAHMTFVEDVDAFNQALLEFARANTRARRAA
jgi:pimeloyl-ACP methyl ester carboxylesterase